MSEFSLIDRYFTHCGAQRDDVIVGVGDDAAVLSMAPAKKLVACVDTLVEGVHFLAGADPSAIGFKSLAVNLSDFAAMGAVPKWATLAISMPEENNEWLNGFAQGFGALANQWQVSLVGGDTTRGPLTISVQLMGDVSGTVLTRAGAEAEQKIYVTGTLGDAALGLQCLNDDYDCDDTDRRYFISRLEWPGVQLELGQALPGIASAAIDISDGLVSDLGHILEASGVGAVVDVNSIPISDAYHRFTDHGGDRDFALSFGDDYELCFTAAPKQHSSIMALARQLKVPVTAVGWTTADRGLQLEGESGKPCSSSVCGYRHF